MQRNLKFGLYGLVLAGLLGGTAGWVSTSGRTIDLRVDGQERQIHTSAKDVQGVLAAAHVPVGAHDLIAPDLGTQLENGAEVVVRHGHLLHLMVNGAARNVWVNAASVDEALGQLGYGSDNLVSVSRSTRLDSNAASFSITTPKYVSFKVDGKVVQAVAFGPTLRQAIAQAHLRLSPTDVVSPAINSPVRNREVITIHRVVYKLQVQRQSVGYGSIRQNDPNRAVGNNVVVTSGRNGVRQVTYRLRYVDGKLAGRTIYSNKVITGVVNRRTLVGTKQSYSAPSYSAPVGSGSAQQIAAGMVSARGWGSDQFGCLVSLWNKESGWSTNAANPSGAYGIPQALPGSKMASAGGDWQTSASTQIAWGLGYIASVYGTPCSAWAHSQATNWY